MEQSVLARCVTCLLTANVSSFTSLRLCPPLVQDKNRIITDVPKRQLGKHGRWIKFCILPVGSRCRKLSAESERGPGASALWLGLQPVGMAGPYMDKGFSSLFLTVHSCLFAKALLLMCMATWFDFQKPLRNHLKQKRGTSQVKAPSTQTDEKQKITWKWWVGRSKGAKHGFAAEGGRREHTIKAT